MQPHLIPFTGPGKRLDNVTGHVVHGPPYNPHLMIQQISPPFVFKQFRYVMNGRYTGELFLSYTMECQFRSAKTGKLTEQHGRWHFCNHIQAIKVFFDFDGRPDLAKKKWTLFRGTEGMDYMGRQIKVIPNADWLPNADGLGFTRCPLPFVPESQHAMRSLGWHHIYSSFPSTMDINEYESLPRITGQ